MLLLVAVIRTTGSGPTNLMCSQQLFQQIENLKSLVSVVLGNDTLTNLTFYKYLTTDVQFTI